MNYLGYGSVMEASLIENVPTFFPERSASAVVEALSNPEELSLTGYVFIKKAGCVGTGRVTE